MMNSRTLKLHLDHPLRGLWRRGAALALAGTLAASAWAQGAPPAGEIVLPVPSRPLLAEGANLIQNGGFEQGGARVAWQTNDWWRGLNGERNAFTFDLDTNRPFAGTCAAHLSLTRHAGGDLQFVQAVPGLTAGASVQVRCHVRGPENGPSITLQLRKRGAPYTCYLRAQIPMADAWRACLYNTTLPPGAAAGDACVIFSLDQVGECWLDDVAVVRLPARDPGPAPAGNQLRNGSFEVGRDRWYATFRESGGYQNAPAAEEANSAADIESVALSGAPHGRRALHFPVRPRCSVNLTSAYFPLRYGYPATVRFWLRCSAPRTPLRAGLGYDKDEYVKHGEQPLVAGTNWTCYTLPVTPLPSISGTYFFELDAAAPADYWLDGVTVSEGAVPPAVYEEPAGLTVGWAPVPGGDVANIYHRGDRVAFDLLAAEKPGRTSLPLRGWLLDAWDQPVKALAVDLPLDAEGLGRGRLELPSDRFGAFKAQFPSGVAGLPAVEVVYQVLPRLPPPRDVPDSFFGGHVRFTPYNLHIAEQAGFRWLRMHPPLDTKWYVVEPQRDSFVFATAGVQRAQAMGFKILGSFDTVPPFYQDLPPKAVGGFWAPYPPSDWAVYRRYVVKTAQAFGPWIRDWEIWNEPDCGSFLHAPSGQDPEDVYLRILRETAAATREGGLDLNLVGGVMTGGRVAFMDHILALGAAPLVDRLAFHYYHGLAVPTAEDAANLRRWGSVTNRLGRPMGLWMTEGCAWLQESPSWLLTARKPQNTADTVLDGARYVVKLLASYKALGVQRVFLYTAFAHPAGSQVWRDECAALVDVDGRPHSALAAHAAAVALLDDLAPRSLDFVAVGRAAVTVASFGNGARRIDVIWSDRPVPLRSVPGLAAESHVRAFDMLGNPLVSEPLVSADPLYVVSGEPVNLR